ncbi:MAG TPA: hypothetical protein ENI23_14130 [bacterium]|nr:hypothetical protein [bacterium]
MAAIKGSKKTGGRKKGTKNDKTLKQEDALESVRKVIRKDLLVLVKNKLELGKGAYVEKIVTITKEDGTPLKVKGKIVREKVIVYRKLPDSSAIDSLLDRVINKPRSMGDEGEVVPTTVVINVTSEEVEKAKDRIKKKTGK